MATVAPPAAEAPDLSSVPYAYHDLAEVLSKQRALSLPPHRQYDCSIELLSGAPLPSCRLYNLSRPEREAMGTYIHDTLTAGIFRPSTSPLGAGGGLSPKKMDRYVPVLIFVDLTT